MMTNSKIIKNNPGHTTRNVRDTLLISRITAVEYLEMLVKGDRNDVWVHRDSMELSHVMKNG